MAKSSGRKLVVQVCNAKNLMPKDGQATASAYAIVDFDSQRHRTKTKFRDLNPEWVEKLEFFIHNIDSMASEILEISLYNDKKNDKRSNFLGKVKIGGSTFVQSDSEALVYYPLEKRSVFSQIKGEIGLRICYIDENPPASKAVVPPVEQNSEAAPPVPVEEDAKKQEENKDKKGEENKVDEKPKEVAKENEEQKPPPPPDNSKTEEAPTLSPVPTPTDVVENPSITHNEKTKQLKEKIETAKRADLGVNELELLSLASDWSRNACDLVDRMLFLYVRIVKA